MYNDLGLLRNKLTQYTDILQEYFVPPGQLSAFVAEAREVLRAHDAVLLSASIRSVQPSDVLLNYAPVHASRWCSTSASRSTRRPIGTWRP